MRRSFLRILIILAVVYAVLCSILWFVQDSLVFYPTKIELAQWNQRISFARAEAIELPRGDDTVRGYLRPGRKGVAAPTVVYFGGNAERVWGRLGQDVPAGWGFASMAYRGYQPSTGKPSAGSILSDAVAFFDALAKRPDVDGSRIVTWGLSLGAGVAVHVAAERPVVGVVVLAAYDRLSGVGQGHYPWVPVSWLFRNEIAPVVEAPSISAPLLALHGNADVVIPIERGRALKNAWKGEVTWREVEGAGHDDLERALFRGTFLSFLQGLE